VYRHPLDAVAGYGAFYQRVLAQRLQALRRLTRKQLLLPARLAQIVRVDRAWPVLIMHTPSSGSAALSFGRADDITVTPR